MLHDYRGWKKIFENIQVGSATYLTFDYSGIDLDEEAKKAVLDFFSQFRDLKAVDASVTLGFKPIETSNEAKITLESTVEELDLLSAIGASLKTSYAFGFRILLNSSTLSSNNGDALRMIDFNEKGQRFTFVFFGDQTKAEIDELVAQAFSEKKIREHAYPLFKRTISPALVESDLTGTIQDLSSLNQELEEAVLNEKEISPTSHISASTGFNFSLYFLLVHLQKTFKVSREDVDTLSKEKLYNQTFETLKADADRFNRLDDQQKRDFVKSLVSFQSELSRTIQQGFRIDKKISSRQLLRTFSMLSDSGITELDLEKYYEPS